MLGTPHSSPQSSPTSTCHKTSYLLPTPSGFDDDKIGNSIQSLGESNVRAARIESNASEKNTLRNLLFNLRTQKRQMVVERLKAMSVFDEPLAESLGEQILEIEAEIKEYTSNLDSIMGAEMTTPPRKNLTPPRD